MNRKDYYNTINLQVEDLDTLVEGQVASCFSKEKLAALLPQETMKNLRRVVLTGCGDSYSAALAMVRPFQLLSGLKDCAAPDPMEFCRCYTLRQTTANFQPDQTLVVAVSASGGSERIVEMMEKAKGQGAHAMLISNNPESKGAKAAHSTFWVETPAGCNSPGLRSYFASMIGILALGAYVGLVQGHLSEEEFETLQQDIISYTHAYLKDYDTIDEQMFQCALQLKDVEKFEAVGDSGDGGSALFVEQKVIECSGVFCQHADSEDWCHISFFLRDPAHIGTVMILNEDSPNRSRMEYTIDSAIGVGRPTIVVTDSEKPFEGAVVCRGAKPAKEWLAPLMNFIPGSLLAGYHAAVNDKLFFGGAYDYRTQTWL